MSRTLAASPGVLVALTTLTFTSAAGRPAGRIVVLTTVDVLCGFEEAGVNSSGASP